MEECNIMNLCVLLLFLVQVYSIFVLLGLGAGIAVCFAIGECLYFRHFFHHVHTRRQLSQSKAAERRQRIRQQFEASQSQPKQYTTSDKSLGKTPSGELGFVNGSFHGTASERSDGGTLSELGVIGGHGEEAGWRRREVQAEIGSASSVELSKGCANVAGEVRHVGFVGCEQPAAHKDVEAGVVATAGVNGGVAAAPAGVEGGTCSAQLERVGGHGAVQAAAVATGNQQGFVVSRPVRWYDVSSWFSSGHGSKEQ